MRLVVTACSFYPPFFSWPMNETLSGAGVKPLKPGIMVILNKKSLPGLKSQSRLYAFNTSAAQLPYLLSQL